LDRGRLPAENKTILEEGEQTTLNQLAL